jgi:hypothetical protein
MSTTCNIGLQGFQPHEVCLADCVDELVVPVVSPVRTPPAAACGGAVFEQGAEPGVPVPRRDHAGQQLEDRGDGGHPGGETDR